MWCRWVCSLAVLLWVALCGIVPLARGDQAPALLLANTLSSDIDVTAYLVSEKFDGVRALWDGQVLRPRGGKILRAPIWFVERFPNRPLDGELWIGRGRFERVAGILRKESPVDAEWREVRYLLFELPDAPGTFRERAQELQRIANGSAIPWLSAVEQFEVGSRAELEERLASVVRAGGEGLMLHRAGAPYSTGRSDDLLKMKPFQDAEAIVIGHVSGKGKYQGRLGALRVRTEGGIEFNLGAGLSDALRRDPPPLGTIITYRYRGLTHRGVPRFASYHRVQGER